MCQTMDHKAVMPEPGADPEIQTVVLCNGLNHPSHALVQPNQYKLSSTGVLNPTTPPSPHPPLDPPMSELFTIKTLGFKALAKTTGQVTRFYVTRVTI